MEDGYPGSAGHDRAAQDLDGLEHDAERETRAEHGEGDLLRLGGRSIQGDSGLGYAGYYATPVPQSLSC